MLQNPIYNGPCNDISFSLYNEIVLFEHQSTLCPNMSLRGLYYIFHILQVRLQDDMNKGKIFSRSKIQISRIHYYVIYNGEERAEERFDLNLTDEESDLQVVAHVININPGYNEDLKEKCKALRDYAAFVDMVRYNKERGMNYDEAVNDAVDVCIAQDILREILLECRAEVGFMKSLIELVDEWEEKHKEYEIASSMYQELVRQGNSPEKVYETLERGGISKIVVEALKEENS